MKKWINLILIRKLYVCRVYDDQLQNRFFDYCSILYSFSLLQHEIECTQLGTLVINLFIFLFRFVLLEEFSRVFFARSICQCFKNILVTNVPLNKYGETRFNNGFVDLIFFSIAPYSDNVVCSPSRRIISLSLSLSLCLSFNIVSFSPNIYFSLSSSLTFSFCTLHFSKGIPLN